MEWDLIEFKNLCSNKGIQIPKEYIESLVFKKYRAIYHADKSRSIIEQYFKEYGPMINMNDDNHMRGLDQAWFESTCEVEASLQSMHSMTDILAQIINSTLMNKPLDEKEVSIKKLFRKISTNSILKPLHDKIKTLLDSEEFKYIEAFVNTIKHRKLLTPAHDMPINQCCNSLL